MQLAGGSQGGNQDRPYVLMLKLSLSLRRDIRRYAVREDRRGCEAHPYGLGAPGIVFGRVTR